MGETVTYPLLLLLVPPECEIDAEALRDLRRMVGDEYGAELWVRPFGNSDTAFRLHLIGDWERRTVREVQDHLSPFIEASFYTLDWLEEAG